MDITVMHFGVLLFLFLHTRQVSLKVFNLESVSASWQDAANACGTSSHTLVPGRRYRSRDIKKALADGESVWLNGWRILTDVDQDNQGRVRTLKVDLSRTTNSQFSCVCETGPGAFFVPSSKFSAQQEASEECTSQSAALAELSSEAEVRTVIGDIETDSPHWVNGVTSEGSLMKQCLAARKTGTTLDYLYENCKNEYRFICLREEKLIKLFSPIISLKLIRFADVKEDIEIIEPVTTSPVTPSSVTSSSVTSSSVTPSSVTPSSVTTTSVTTSSSSDPVISSPVVSDPVPSTTFPMSSSTAPKSPTSSSLISKSTSSTPPTVPSPSMSLQSHSSSTDADKSTKLLIVPSATSTSPTTAAQERSVPPVITSMSSSVGLANTPSSSSVHEQQHLSSSQDQMLQSSSAITALANSLTPSSVTIKTYVSTEPTPSVTLSSASNDMANIHSSVTLRGKLLTASNDIEEFFPLTTKSHSTISAPAPYGNALTPSLAKAPTSSIDRTKSLTKEMSDTVTSSSPGINATTARASVLDTPDSTAVVLMQTTSTVDATSVSTTVGLDVMDANKNLRKNKTLDSTPVSTDTADPTNSVSVISITTAPQIQPTRSFDIHPTVTVAMFDTSTVAVFNHSTTTIEPTSSDTSISIDAFATAASSKQNSTAVYSKKIIESKTSMAIAATKVSPSFTSVTTGPHPNVPSMYQYAASSSSSVSDKFIVKHGQSDYVLTGSSSTDKHSPSVHDSYVTSSYHDAGKYMSTIDVRASETTPTLPKLQTSIYLETSVSSSVVLSSGSTDAPSSSISPTTSKYVYIETLSSVTQNDTRESAGTSVDVVTEDDASLYSNTTEKISSTITSATTSNPIILDSNNDTSPDIITEDTDDSTTSVENINVTTATTSTKTTTIKTDGFTTSTTDSLTTTAITTTTADGLTSTTDLTTSAHNPSTTSSTKMDAVPGINDTDVSAEKGTSPDDTFYGLEISLWIAFIIMVIAVLFSLILAAVLYRRRKKQKSQDISGGNGAVPNGTHELRERSKSPSVPRDSATFQDKAYDL